MMHDTPEDGWWSRKGRTLFREGTCSTNRARNCIYRSKLEEAGIRRREGRNFHPYLPTYHSSERFWGSRNASRESSGKYEATNKLDKIKSLDILGPSLGRRLERAQHS